MQLDVQTMKIQQQRTVKETQNANTDTQYNTIKSEKYSGKWGGLNVVIECMKKN